MAKHTTSARFAIKTRDVYTNLPLMHVIGKPATPVIETYSPNCKFTVYKAGEHARNDTVWGHARSFPNKGGVCPRSHATMIASAFRTSV